jgi:hypothetical protein
MSGICVTRRIRTQGRPGDGVREGWNPADKAGAWRRTRRGPGEDKAGPGGEHRYGAWEVRDAARSPTWHPGARVRSSGATAYVTPPPIGPDLTPPVAASCWCHYLPPVVAGSC